MASRVARILLYFFAFVGLLVGVAGFTPLVQSMADRWQVDARVREADAIVVLGGGAGREGLYVHSSARLLQAMLLYRREFADTVAFTGGNEHAPATAHQFSEGQAFLAAWQDFGFPVTHTVVDRRATSTRENAERIASLLPPPRTVILVTSNLHMRRARAAFENMGYEVYPAPVPPRVPRLLQPFSRWQTAAELLYEWAAWLQYAARGWL